MTARVAGRIRIGDLPVVRGRYTEDFDLATVTWFRVGGPADIFFTPADEADLAAFLAALDPEIPVFPMGVGSNLLVRDGGVRGVVIRLATPFHTIEVDTTTSRLRAGAAALDAQVARRAAAAGIAGLEFFRGVPGSIGGACAMNAGCYGRETRDALIEATAYDRRGRRRVLSNADMGFSYRHCAAAEEGLVFTSALLQGSPDDPAAIEARMADLMTAREASQPIRERTGGSTFANPDPAQSGGKKAWSLIEAVGGRGRRLGGAAVSELHCNFLINQGGASAWDIEALGESLRADVAREFGVDLRWEIRRVGAPGDERTPSP